MKRWLSVVLWVLVLGLASVQAQHVYAGLGLSALPEAGFTAGVQVGGAVTEQFGVRALAASNFDLLLFSAEGFYTPNPATATWQGYYGGGFSATWLPTFDTAARTFAPLATLTGGVVYRTGEVGFFGELRLLALLYFPIPLPELRVGANYYF